MIAMKEMLELFNIKMSTWSYLSFNVLIIILSILVVIFRTVIFPKNVYAEDIPMKSNLYYV